MKSILKNSFFFLLTLLSFAACEKTIELDPRQTPEVYIMEGLVTDQLDRHSLRITRPQSFNVSGEAPGVSGALVQVSDDAGNTYAYEEVKPGLYQAKEAFAGVTGRIYRLRVSIGEKQFTAEEELRPISPLNQLEYQIDEEEKADPEDEGRYYEVLVYLNEPQATEDYYLARFYRNSELLTEKGSRVFVFEDRTLGPNINALPIPYYYAKDDTARVEVYSLSRRAYRFYVDLQNNITNDGGLFSGQPANVGTNIEGGSILGYFQVSGLTVGQLQVK